MPSVMHTADHSHKMRKICSDGQLINDGGSVNMYIVLFFFCCCQSEIDKAEKLMKEYYDKK